MDYYSATIFLTIFTMVILEINASKSNILSRGRKKLFICVFNMIILASACEWMGIYLQGTGSSTRILHILVKATELSVVPFIGCLIAWIIDKRGTKAVTVFLIVHAVVEFSSGIFGFIYSVDENSNYKHEELYWIYVLAYVIAMAYCVFVIISLVKKDQYNGTGFILLITSFMISGIVIRKVFTEIRVEYITFAISVSMLYIFAIEVIQQKDELTELLNRRGFENCISHIEGRCIVVFFDIDDFKLVNDVYGHKFGDDVLKIVGKAIKKNYSNSGKCFRYGGDEFCVILKKNQDMIKDMNQNFLETMNQSRDKDDRIPLVSVGYSYYDNKIQEIQDAIDIADRMMYKFKSNNKEQQENTK